MLSKSLDHLLATRDKLLGNIREAASLLAESAKLAEGTGLDIAATLRTGTEPGIVAIDSQSGALPLWTTAAGLKAVASRLDSAAWIQVLADSQRGPSIAAGRRAALKLALSENRPPAFTVLEVRQLFEPDPVIVAPSPEEQPENPQLERLLLQAFRNLSWNPHTNRPRPLQEKTMLHPVLSWGGGSVDHETADSLDALVGAFTLLDGQPRYESGHEVYAQMARARRKQVFEIKMDYLDVHWTPAGDGHMVAKRQRLLALANEAITNLVARKPWLLGPSTCAADHDTGPRSRAAA